MANYFGSSHKNYWGSVFEGFVENLTLDELEVAEVLVGEVKR